MSSESQNQESHPSPLPGGQAERAALPSTQAAREPAAQASGAGAADALPTAAAPPGDAVGAAGVAGVPGGGLHEQLLLDAHANIRSALEDLANYKIGPYRLLERIGEGGFGDVWLAERREPIVQRVALKIIKPGMDTRGVVARFEQERQALAVMNHPNVAKVFDAGTTPQGRPYFVMEHVRGEPITAYCDRHKLTIKQRLELLIPVCDAVQHAHHKGIIHRDIKPSNVLVTIVDEKPVPKVIDFGVAKAISQTLTEKTIFTETGQLIGTPEYMSPEQAEMGATDVDTRTDVYSLGVLLYELLTGTVPFEARELRSRGYNEIVRIIREVEPPKPSTRLSGSADARSRTDARRTDVADLTRVLRRELDWIPLKALRKDRTERYATPADLARDIERYLKGDPLEAGPESAAYRVRKFVRRNRGLVASMSAVGVTVLLGLGGTLWQANTARREARRANFEAELARATEIRERRERERADMKAEEAETERTRAVRAAETIEYNLYLANVNAAGAAVSLGDYRPLRSHLDDCPVRLRGWEWRWLDAIADSSLLTFRSESPAQGLVSFSSDGSRIVYPTAGRAVVWDIDRNACVSELIDGAEIAFANWSPDNATIVTTSADTEYTGPPIVWNAITGQIEMELSPQLDAPSWAVYSSDGSKILTYSVWGDVYGLWDSTNGNCVAAINLQATSGACMSPDGTRLFTFSAVPINVDTQVWDLECGTIITELREPFGRILDAAFSPDGRRIVTASDDGAARVWDAQSGELLRSLKEDAAKVKCALFIADGKKVVTGSADSFVRIWNAATGRCLARYKTDAGVNCVAISADGRTLAIGLDDGGAASINLSEQSAVNLIGHTAAVRSVEFDPTGRRILTSSADKTIKVWNSQIEPNPIALEGEKSGVMSATFSADGTRIVATYENSPPRLFDAARGRLVAELSSLLHLDPVFSATFDAAGSRVITISDRGIVMIWDAKAGWHLSTLNTFKSSPKSQDMDFDASLPLSQLGDGTPIANATAQWAADGSYVVTADGVQGIRRWDNASRALVSNYSPDDEGVACASLTADASRIAVVERDGSVSVRDTSTMAELIRLRNSSGVNGVLFSSDGTRIATRSNSGVVELWSAQTSARIAEFECEFWSPFCFSRDNGRMAIAGRGAEALICDVRTGSVLTRLRGHRDSITCLSFGPDGSRIVTGSNDHSVRIWDSHAGRTVVEFCQHSSSIRCSSFSNDGTRLVTGSSDGTLLVCDSVPYRIRCAEREANARGEDGSLLVKDYLRQFADWREPASVAHRTP